MLFKSKHIYNVDSVRFDIFLFFERTKKQPHDGINGGIDKKCVL